MSSFNLVRPAGFEPTTPWFVAKYSIQLSYGRIIPNFQRPANRQKEDSFWLKRAADNH